MSANTEKIEHTYTQQLTDLAEQLQHQSADESLLDSVHSAIETMMSENSEVEADIRRVLEEQYRAGNLREETFELVQGMLDRMVSEDLVTAFDEPGISDHGDDPFRDTTVIETLKPEEQSAVDRLQVGSVLRDRFLLQERVSGGSMGVVYKALDRRLAEADGVDPWVAIKVLTPKLARNGHALRALQQEAVKGRCLTHPNIVRFIDLDREDDLYFIVMEWLEGKSLANILDHSISKKIDKETALDIVKQVAKALDYAHRRGVIHADIKPGNIMISPDGEVKLFDFGIARIRQKQTDNRADFDRTQLDAKTPAYSSMQVLTGEEPEASDDVFSLGCLMYRLVAGYRVFGPRNAAEAANEGMEPQRPQGLDDAEWYALRKALSYSRVARFPTPSEFTRALSSPPPLSKPLNVEPDLHQPFEERRRFWPYVAATGILVIGAVSLYQSGLLERLIVPLERMTTTALDTITESTPPSEPPAIEEDIVEQPLVEESVLEGPFVEDPFVEEPAAEEPAAEELVTEDGGSPFESTLTQIQAQPSSPDEVAEPVPMIDFSTLPPATVEVPLAFPGTARTEVDLVLREDGEPAIIDLVRVANVDDALMVRLEEVGHSGNRSPWEAGQYHVSDDSMAQFPPGQERARVVVSMAGDPLREPDRQVSLLVRDAENAESEFALINLSLEDDDQRRFESELGPNTVAFAVSQVSVRERDPAVQIDVVRLNPDQTSLTVDYVLREVTASEGEDYFVPGSKIIRFGPGQRSARILIPLVQDSTPEADEAFVLEMQGPEPETANANIYRRIAVMIRDDDSTLE